MKVLEEFAKCHNLILVPVKFNFQGIRIKRHGFDLCRHNGGIIITIEPIDRYNGAKWYISSQLLMSDALRGNKHKRAYVKRITKEILSQFPTVGGAYIINTTHKQQGAEQ